MADPKPRSESRSLFGNDTVIFNSRTLADFGSGEVAKITFPTEIASVKAGKEGNTIYVQNVTGHQAVLEIKVIRGSADDHYFLDKVKAYKNYPSLYVLDTAQLSKFIGSGKSTTGGPDDAPNTGKQSSDKYTLNHGIPTKQQDVVTNLDGDTEQAIAVYTWTFANCDRTYG